MKPPFADIAEWLSYWLSGPQLAPADQRVLERYYGSYVSRFGPYVRRHYASQIREMEEFVARHPGCRVLEIGCGCGTESIWLGLHGASVTGIDLDRDRLAVARARLAHTNRVLGLRASVAFEEKSVLQAPELKDFDAVWMEQAFHHVEPRSEFLERLRSLVRPGGALVISEANAWNPFLQAQLFARRGFRTLRTYTDSSGRTHPYGNERITTSRRLAQQLERAGFRIRSRRHFRLFPNAAWAERLLGVESLVPGWCTPAFTAFNLVAERLSDSTAPARRNARTGAP